MPNVQIMGTRRTVYSEVTIATEIFSKLVKMNRPAQKLGGIARGVENQGDDGGTAVVTNGAAIAPELGTQRVSARPRPVLA